MINDKDSIRLIDFGLARIQSRGEDGSIAGTPLYMAPEVIIGKTGKESDIWSLGVLLYTLVSGYMPFYEKTT